MAVKIDKEVLIKHHFWILTGLCVILVLIPIFCLWFGVNDTVAAEEKKLTEAKNKAKGITNPKNEKHVEAYKKQDGYVEKKQTEVWKQASETQLDLMTWPEKLIDQFPSFKTKYFGDPIEQFADNLYAQEYTTQLPAVLAIVQPLAPKVNLQGVDKIVQFKGDSWNAVLQIDRKFEGTPTREDIWLAQEDLWVKRELLAVVRAANDAVATLHEVKPQQPPAVPAPAPAAKDAKDAKEAKSLKDAKDAKMARLLPAPVTDRNHKVFKNYFWEMDLILARNAKNKWVLRGKITNIGKQRRSLGAFRIYLAQDSAPAILPVSHEPLAAGQSADLGEYQVADALNISGLYGVEEVLTWRTAPVKRIDDVELDKNCSRFARYSYLQEPRWVEKAAEQPAGAAAEPGMGGDMRDKMGGVAKGGGLGQAGSGGQGGTTKNGLSLKRYIDTNNQVRHMPVGMVVIVDEDFIHEFLGAFANSRLRTQTLQCHWHHIREKIKPTSEGGAPAAGQLAEKGKPQDRDAMPGAMRPSLGKGGAPAEPGMGGGMRMQGPSGQAKGMGGGGMLMPGMGGGMAGGFRPTETGDEEEAEMNLVELSVYGLASLYEKYPPKPETPAAEAPKN